MTPTNRQSPFGALKRLKPDRASVVVMTTLLFVVAALTALVFLADRQTLHLTSGSLKSFSGLHRAYEKKGLAHYLREKENLRHEVASILQKNSKSLEAIEASNIAVFLFPDLLPDSNFEKMDALELWYPHQMAIERAPHTLDSRQKFEDLRANIYNYENPDRDEPQLSDQARQVIRIYDTLSAL